MGDLKRKTRAGAVLIQANYDLVRGGSEDTGLYCLTQQQAMYLLSIVYMAKWPTRWFSPSDTPIDQDWIDAFCSNLETQLMTDRCQEILDRLATLQTTVDEIDDDVDALDTSITTINDNITTINNTLTVVNNNLTVVENNVTLVQQQNTTINITLNLPSYTFTSDQADTTNTYVYARYNGFCLSIQAWIMSAGYRILQIRSAPQTDLDAILVQMKLMSLNVVLGFGLTSGDPFSIDEIRDALLDEAAVNDVACAMITKLFNLRPDAANFNAALTSYTPPAYPNHRWILAEICLLYLNDLDGFTPWANINEFYFQQALAANPTGYDCPPCNPPGYCTIPQTWDLTLLQVNPWTMHRGILTQGVGILGTTTPDDPSNYTWDIEWYLPSGGCTFFSPNKLNFFTRVRPGTNGQFIIHYYTTPTQTTPTEVTFTTSGNEQTIPWTLNGTYYKSIRVYPVTNGGYFGFVSLATASYAKLSKITLTAS